MPEENPTGGAPRRDDPPETRTRNKKVDCGYCGCTLDSEGEIITMGKRAKEFRAMAENDETRISRISALEAELSDLKNKLAAATAAPSRETPPAGRKSVMDTLVPTGR